MLGELKLSLAAEVLLFIILFYYLSLVIILIEDNTSGKLFINFYFYTIEATSRRDSAYSSPFRPAILELVTNV